MIARKGYAKNGSGSDSGVYPSPPKPLDGDDCEQQPCDNANDLTHEGITLDELTSSSEAAHNPSPAANTGPLAAKSIAEVARIVRRRRTPGILRQPRRFPGERDES